MTKKRKNKNQTVRTTIWLIRNNILKKISLNTCRYGKWDYNESICITKKEEKEHEKTF
ncbi:hypothetical protein [Blautia wexlerae]|jgi:hypothetical protein|uniref:hypothetical protein n=1 Tax=Blautia wexlerae TaxID=418240 RepID=UPI0034A50187